MLRSRFAAVSTVAIGALLGAGGLSSAAAAPPTRADSSEVTHLSDRAHVVASNSTLAAGLDAMAAYQQGGSVYTEQVPAAATQHAYGGSVYSEQVPSFG